MIHSLTRLHLIEIITVCCYCYLLPQSLSLRSTHSSMLDLSIHFVLLRVTGYVSVEPELVFYGTKCLCKQFKVLFLFWRYPLYSQYRTAQLRNTKITNFNLHITNYYRFNLSYLTGFLLLLFTHGNTSTYKRWFW